VGYDHAIGFLKGGFDSWKISGKKSDTITTVTAMEFAEVLKTNRPVIVDVRKPSEYDHGHLQDAASVPLDVINDHMHEFNRNTTTYIHCAGGYRSMIAASILKARGYENIIDVAGGYSAIIRAGLQT
jgi:rhodanese-related sulfurtransferase